MRQKKQMKMWGLLGLLAAFIIRKTTRLQFQNEAFQF